MALSATATVSGGTATVTVSCDAGAAVNVQAGIAFVGAGTLGGFSTSGTLPAGLASGDLLLGTSDPSVNDGSLTQFSDVGWTPETRAPTVVFERRGWNPILITSPDLASSGMLPVVSWRRYALGLVAPSVVAGQITAWRGVDQDQPIDAVGGQRYRWDTYGDDYWATDWLEVTPQTPGAVVVAARSVWSHTDDYLLQPAIAINTPAGYLVAANNTVNDLGADSAIRVPVFYRRMAVPASTGAVADVGGVWPIAEGHFTNAAQQVALRPAPGVGYGTVGAVPSSGASRQVTVTGLAPETVLTVSDGTEVATVRIAGSLVVNSPVRLPDGRWKLSGTRA